MNKYKFASALLGAAIVLSPFMASAATISNPLFSNGQTSIDATGGATVSGTFTLTVGPGEVVEQLRTQSDPSQPFVDASVGGQLGYQEQVYTNIPFSVKVPPNTGTYYPTVQGAGAFGGNRAINGGDNVFPSSITLGSTGLGTIRVVANGGGTGTIGTTAPAGISQELWDAFLASLTKPTPPAVAPECTAYVAAKAGTMMGVYSDANSALQGFLLSQHLSIPALKAGAAFGFYGPQTQNAESQFLATHKCN